MNAVVRNAAALVRAGPALSSEPVGELLKGTQLVCGAAAFHDGVARREVLAPLRGWASAKCLADAPPPAPPPGPDHPRMWAKSDAPPAGPEPPPWLWAISDVHTDHAANLAWLRRMCARDAFRRDGLILAGDVSSRFSILRETLELCKSAFAEVSFVVGNHDLWVTKSEPWADSLAKLDAVDALCDELGVHRAPALVGGCVVAPIYAWHHASFDKEPDVTGWSGLPAHNKCLSDFFLAKFPGLDQTTDSVAEALDARNGDLEDRDAALRRAHPALLLVTFSHFVPRPELVPDKRYLFVPALAKAVGSTFLQRRVASYDRTFTSSATRTSAGMRRWTAPATSKRASPTRASAATASPPSRRGHSRTPRRRRYSSERATRSCRATSAAGALSTT